jgi:small subunit ribosomal protein S4
VFGTQLRAKQLAKRYYGIRERQFRRYIEAATRDRGQTGEQLLIALERRLDNVVYRLGFASTRAQARQFVSHGHVLVDGRRVDIPSYAVRPGQTVALRAGSAIKPLAREATELMSTVAPWFEADLDRLEGRVLRLPERREIQAPVEEQLIVEFYSRR